MPERRYLHGNSVTSSATYDPPVQTREQQMEEALRRLRHMAVQSRGMTRDEILDEVKRVTNGALGKL
jgi:hypothetical protein